MAQAAHAFLNEGETERLRSIFDKSFQNSAGNETESNIEDTNAAVASGQPARRAGDDFDWSITLENINLLTEASKEKDDRVAAAELRAERAEQRSAELEQWLRRLHQAVLKGLPQK